jgi:acetolactate synthase-1/2/3 large subunit
MTLSWLFLEVAAWLHLCQVPGTWFVGRRVLCLSDELPRLSSLAAAIFTVMGAAVVLVLVVLGVLIGSHPTEVLTTHLGLGLCAFLGTFWFLRLLIQLFLLLPATLAAARARQGVARRAGGHFHGPSGGLPRRLVDGVNVASALVSLLRPFVGLAVTVAGAGNVPFIVAWSREGLTWVNALEEKRALLMAEGFGRATGRLALVSTTAGPGATNLATGLGIALRERTAVFVVAGQTPRHYAGRLPVQELDTKLFSGPLTRKSHELTAAESLEPTVRELLRTALDARHPGPVLLAVPADLWAAPCALAGPVLLPESWSGESARRIGRALAEARHPLVLAGSGVIQAGVSAELRALVDRLPHARVATTPRALGAFPSDDPRSAGSTGFGGSVDRDLDLADLVLVLGSRLHEMSTNYDARFARVPLIHLDIDPDVPGHAYAGDAVCADLRVALPALIAALEDAETAPSSGRQPRSDYELVAAVPRARSSS